MPLQTGASALRDLLIGSVVFVPGYILILFGTLGMFVVPSALTGWVTVILGGMLVGGFGMRQLSLAVRDRPSDLLLDAVGLRIVGGPHEFGYYATRVPWTELAKDAWRVRRVEGTEMSELVTGPPEAEIVLAHATDFDEIQSLSAVADMAGSTAEHLAGASRQPTAVATLPCPTCGAPVRADDADTVTCSYCNHVVPVPPATRERIRAARELGAAQRITPRLLQRFLQQPSARVVNVMGVVAGALMLAVWPAVIGFGGWLYYLDRLEATAVIALLLLAPASIWLVYSLAIAVTASRRALQLVGLGCSANAGASGHPECRLCGAVLPAEEQVVVACPFCGTPNVLGVDLRGVARDALADEEELQFTLRLNATRRFRARMQVGLALLVFALGVLLLASCLFIQ